MFNGSLLFQERPSFTDDYLQAMWNASADLDGWIKNLALSMTNVVRTTNTSGPFGLYDGTGYQLGVQIHWPWITLPAVLVAMSLIILIVTIVQTARSPVKAWKGSPLALLFMDVDPSLKKAATGQMENFNGIEDLIGITKVVMKPDGDADWIIKAL